MARRYWDDGWTPLDDVAAHDYDPEPDWDRPTPQELELEFAPDGEERDSDAA